MLGGGASSTSLFVHLFNVQIGVCHLSAALSVHSRHIAARPRYGVAESTVPRLVCLLESERNPHVTRVPDLPLEFRGIASPTARTKVHCNPR